MSAIETRMAHTAHADHTMGTYRRAKPLFVRGEGAWIIDADGRRYLDLISGIGASCLGHGHPRLAAAIADQAATLGHVSNLYRHGPGEELSARLCARTGMDAVFFSNSGAEANEAALKIARKVQVLRGHPERQSFVALQGGFHGRTFGSLSTTSNHAYRAPFGSMLDVRFVPSGDVDALAEALRAGPAGLIVEPIQGEGGLRALPGDYLRAARALCDETGTVLIHDEVQCGGARTGRYLAAEHHGVVPDVVVLAKPLGGGLPIGATLARGEFATALVPGDHGSTFGGGTLACRAALAVLDELDAGLDARIALAGARLAAGLDRLVERHDSVRERRGLGLMQGLALVEPDQASKLVELLQEPASGIPVLTCTASGGVLRLLPPFVLTDDDIDLGLERIDSALVALSAAHPVASSAVH